MYHCNTMEWLAKWRLKLSINKTIFTIFNKAGRNLSDRIELLYNLDPIAYEKNPKLLGVVLDPALTFSKHAEYVKSRATSRMNMIRSLKGKAWGANTKLLLITYKALIRSLIDYAPSTTITMQNSTRAVYERIQSKAIRCITHWPHERGNSAMLQEHSIEEILPRTNVVVCFV